MRRLANKRAQNINSWPIMSWQDIIMMITEISRGEGMHRRPVKCAPDKHFHFFLCRESSNIYFSNISARQETNESVWEHDHFVLLHYYLRSTNTNHVDCSLFSFHYRSITGEYCCQGADGSSIGRYWQSKQYPATSLWSVRGLNDWILYPSVWIYWARVT